jgi:hypothetical protein
VGESVRYVLHFTFTPDPRLQKPTPRTAHALASPVRNDRSLGTLLPSALLVTLHLKPHPTTADPWLLPLSLSAPNSPKHLGPPLRLLAHRHNAAHLTAKKENVKRALSARHAALLGSSGMRQLVWRQDMPALLLSLLRTRVEDKLSWYFARQGRLVPVASPAPADIDAVDDAACVLFYGSLRTRADDVHDRANAIVAEADKWALYFRAHFGSYFDAHATPPPNLPKATHHPPNWFEPVVPRLAPRAQFPPLAFPTARWRGRKVALYSLSDMLGAERAAALVSGTPCEEERCWVLRRGRQNVGVEMVLGLLQGYLVEPGAVWEGR